MAGHDIVVVGGSAGALAALMRLVAELPRRFPASMLVAIHRSPTLPGVLPLSLERCTLLPVSFAVDGEEFEPGRIYVAPPDHHLLISGAELRVTRGPREHGL